jgi:hypothetical protein
VYKIIQPFIFKNFPLFIKVYMLYYLTINKEDDFKKMKSFILDKQTNIVFMLLIVSFLFTELQILAPLTSVLRFALIFFILVILGISLRFGIKKELVPILTIGTLFQTLYLIRLYDHYKPEAVIIIFYQFIFLTLFVLMATLKWKESHERVLLIIPSLVFPVLLFFTLTNSDSINPNTLGAYYYFISFFLFLRLINTQRKITTLVILLLIMFAISLSDTRSILASSLAALFTWFFWKVITKTKFTHFAYISLFFFSKLFLYSCISSLR